MEDKKSVKISLSTFFLFIAIIVIIVMAVYIYIDKTNSNKKMANLETNAVNMQTTIDKLQNEIDSMSNTKSNNTEDNSNKDNVSYMIIQVEDTSAGELASKMKIITDEKEIKSLMNIINSAKEYESTSFIPDFGDMPPTVEVYLANGEKYTIIARDNINDDGNVVNLVTKWYKQDGSDKTLFKVDTKLAEYIEKLYKTINTSSLTSEKEIYKKVSVLNMDNSELEKYNETFIVLENGKIYFSNNLSDKILEGTYTVNSNNTIEYKPLKETKDYAFYNASTFKFENINSKKNIIVDNDPNGTMYFQKVE